MAAKRRSPQYPFVNLETALDLLRALYQKVERGAFLPKDAAKAWGFNTVSGMTRSKITALRQYGLIEGKTRGKDAESPKLSLRGVALARRNPTVFDKEYLSELQEAALAPPAFREIHDMPEATDELLQHQLVVEKDFTEDGAKRCIEAYRATIQFANLGKKETVPGKDTDISIDKQEVENIHPDESDADSSPEGQHPGMMKIRLSAEDDDYAWVKRKMTEEEWALRIALFKAYKPAIVRNGEKKLESAQNDVPPGSDPEATTPPATLTQPECPRSSPSPR